MPPGNSNNKAAVRNKCTFCGKSTCIGNECYLTRYPPRNYEPIISPIFTSTSVPVSPSTRSETNAVRGQPLCAFCGKQTCAGSSCRNVRTAGGVNETGRPSDPVAKTVSVKRDELVTTSSIYGSSSQIRSSGGVGNASSNVTAVSNTNLKINPPVDKSSSSSIFTTGTAMVKQNIAFMPAFSTEGINAEVRSELKQNVADKSVVATPSSFSVSAASTTKITKDEQCILPKTLSSEGKSLAAKENSSLRIANNKGRNSLPDDMKSTVISFIAPQENSETASLQKKSNLPGSIIPEVSEKIKGNPVLQGEDKSLRKNLSTGEINKKIISVHLRTEEEVSKGTAQNSNISIDKKIQGSKRGCKMVDKIGSNCSEDGSESLSSVNDQKPRKHSKGAVMYDGVLVKFIGPRIAMVQVTSPGAKNKTVQLFVDRLLLSASDSFYSVNTDIKSVLCIGDTLKLVCTNYNKKDNRFDFFAHEAWKVENFNANKYDSESVASFLSHDSLSGSETQERNPSKSRYRSKMNKNVPKSEDPSLSDAIYQWLDQNNCVPTSNNFPKKVTLLEDCSYIGNVTEVRLPFIFIVGISVNDALEYVFGMARKFYPDGPDSQPVAIGVKVDCHLHVGMTVALTVARSAILKEDKYEWVVKKAWPFGKGNKTFRFVGDKMIYMEPSDVSAGKLVQVPQIESKNTTNSTSVTGRISSDVYGEIVTLQSNWGLVKEIGGLSTYIFLRKNAFLFGVCLQNFVLDDVLDEGQLVWFNKDNGEDKIYVNKLWHGDKLFNFNSFEKVMRSYCEENRISFHNENSLVKLGKGFYLKN